MSKPQSKLVSEESELEYYDKKLFSTTQKIKICEYNFAKEIKKEFSKPIRTFRYSLLRQDDKSFFVKTSRME